MVCKIFEKSGGLGGRLATREIEGLTLDHGVQYFRVRGPSFSQFLDRCIKEGKARVWTDDLYVGAPQMKTLAHALAEGLDIEFNFTANSLVRRANEWCVSAGTEARSGFDAIIISIPAIQAAELLSSSGVSFRGMDEVRYSPCITLIKWISQNSSKPDRKSTPQTFVVHTHAEWSLANLDTPLEKIKADLLVLSNDIIKTQSVPIVSSVHRWKYAFVSKKANSTFFWNQDALLGACGDYCLGASVEAAFNSGEALASRIISVFR
jgi:predicted NAD/FAD-dependent oxidoreductase